MSPLHGSRVLDLSISIAGAATGAILADLGAEVIKVESPNHQNSLHGWPTGERDPGSDPIPLPFDRATNRNISSVILDLERVGGRTAFFLLAANSDVVVENFRPDVLVGLRLGYAHLKQANPDIIFASMSSQGATIDPAQ
jgi:crotonobetainyl-CoA:carnitine CoA-transferase CaiB-like acyl-CoA transferase